MATLVDKEQPQLSGLSSSTVLDALNNNVSNLEYMLDIDSASYVVECEVKCSSEKQELGTSNDTTNESDSTAVQYVHILCS